jgi:hypothetical protein
MAVEIIKGETELIPESRVYAPAGSAFPLAGLDDRRFEKLIYWIYREEIETGAWKDRYDEIRLMSGVRDDGKDCVLYKNNIQYGVIQCKHSANNTALDVATFAKEVIKFGLYSLVESRTIKIYTDYEYYVAVSAQFQAKTLDLIDNFKTTFTGHADFKKWTQQVIRDYKGLNHFKYDFIETQLKANLEKLQLLKIDGDEINRRLETDVQNTVVKAFFTIRSVVDNEALTPIKAQLDEISGQLLTIDDNTKQIAEAVMPQPERKPFAEVPGYLDRSVSGEAEEIQFYILGETRTLAEIVQKHRKVALLGSGLLGKSTELEQVAHLLSKADPAKFVYLIKLDVSGEDPIRNKIKGIDMIPPKDLVVLLDGLDEVVPQYQVAARNMIEDFVRDHGDCLIVVSCRTNIYITEKENTDVNTLPGFESFTLQKLADKEIKKYLGDHLGKDKEEFLKCIGQYDLEDLLAIPFYLIRFVEQFQVSRHISNSKVALFEGIIRNGIKADVDRLKPADPLRWEARVYEALVQLSTVLEIMGKNFFTHTDLQQLFDDGDLLMHVKNTASLIQGNDRTDGAWSFLHNNFQEYLAAQQLSRLTFKGMQQAISFQPENTVMKPTWLSTVSFLLNTLPDDATPRRQLLAWLEKENSGQLMMIDPGTLKAAYRLDIFKRNYEEQKKKDTPFHHQRFNLKFVGRFIQSDPALEFVINELNSDVSETLKQALLKIVLFFDLLAVPVHQADFKTALLKCIRGQDDYTRMLAINAWNTLFKVSFAEFDVILKTHKATADSGVRSSLFAMIYKQGFAEQYVAHLLTVLEEIERERNQYNQQKSSDNKRYLDEHIWIDRSLLQIKSPQAVATFLDWMVSYAPRKFFPSQLKDSFPHVLGLIDGQKQPEFVAKVAAIYLETGPYYLQEKKDFIAFFKRNDQLGDIFKKVYALKTPPRYTELQILAVLADEPSIDFLIGCYQNKALSLRDMEQFQGLLSDEQLSLKIYFNMQMNALLPFPFPIVPDTARKTYERDARKAAMFFDKALFRQEVAKPMNKLGLTKTLYQGLQALRTQNHQDDKFFDFAFDVLRREDDWYEIDLDLVLKEIDDHWVLLSMQWIYLFAKQQYKWDFTAEQKAYIVNWCDAEVSGIDLYQDRYYDERRGHAQKALILVYFVRLYELRRYPDQFYLDMLYYPESEHAVEQLAFIEQRCSHAQIVAQMLDNLYHRPLNGIVLERHLKYFRTFKIIGAATGLFELLKSEDTYNWHEVLEAFKELGGDQNRLWELLLLLKTDYYHDTVIDRLIKIQPQAVKAYLLDLFDRASEERKLPLARILIKLQSRKGLRYYADYIKLKKSVPDYTSPDNALFRIHSIRLADLAIRLYRLSFNADVRYESINSLHYISSTVIQNIYLAHGNRFKMKLVLKILIAWLKLSNRFSPKEVYPSMIKDLQYLIEGFEHQQELKMSSFITFPEAIVIYIDLTNGNYK